MQHIFHLYKEGQPHRYTLKPASIRDRVIAQLLDGIVLGGICSAIFYLFSDGEIYSIWVSPIFPQYLLEIEPGHVRSAADFWWGGYYFSWNLPYGKTVYLNYPSPLLWVLYALYYVLFITQWGQTPGKMSKKIVVLDLEGQRVDYKKGLLRWLGCLVSFLPLGIGFWWGEKAKDHRTWHDLLAGTIVYSFEEK